MDFLALGNTSECQGEREAMDRIMSNRKQYLQTVLAEFVEHKKDLLLEMGSMRSPSRASSVSSAAVRAQVRAEAAAAFEKVELQKRRSLAEAQSTLLIQQEEMALARKRKEEQGRMERLRLEEEAEVAMEKVKVVDEELGVGVNMEELLNMPELSARRKVERFITEQCIECNDISQFKEDETDAPPVNIQNASAPGVET